MTENHPSDIQASPPRRKHPWGRIIGVAVILVVVPLGVWAGIWYHQFKQNLKARNCPYNLQEIGLVCYMWEHENNNRWPRLSDLPGEFMLDPDAVSKAGGTLREYIPRMAILSCPRASDAPGESFPGDATYVYLGPGLETEDEAIPGRLSESRPRGPAAPNAGVRHEGLRVHGNRHEIRTPARHARRLRPPPEPRI